MISSTRSPSLHRAPGLRPLALAGCAAIGLLLAGCDQKTAVTTTPSRMVRTEVVKLSERRQSITLTGDVQARVLAELSFRVSGRVTERLVEVGAYVKAGQVLARIDPAEQQADLDSAQAAVVAAESQVKVATSNFNRQQTLITSGFTTRASFDQAQETLRTAEGSLEAAKAQLGTAKDALTYTELRADADGTITARNIEVGQVAQAAQSVFTLAHDGNRDAVIDVYEAALSLKFDDSKVALALLSDPSVTAKGTVREVSPTIDPKSGTVRVKITIENPPPEMVLGSAVSATGFIKPEQRIILPWSALNASGKTPAVWLVDAANKTVSLKPITIEDYETGAIVVSGGLKPGDRVVTEGGKLLSVGQQVSFNEEARS
ncbi:putative component of multidrug efflux system (RND family) [Bradyrhizobium sp. ORS 375]|uniref:efflux RND transporter periplasmic adaptor subunit n=1 Tax=Bradyrhizobium sp. (strain ORS 375) TaxID=566679 RepID=UPI000240634F|nr:efflux RND transporter periplasmic adaptor subunit [Bradyrhizobium sp. ORS 375]CCD93030.1 putative component of multidrug efflux system (RND family) [Bradyrhizobium sp. ORS 375]